jgi:hypothetical protein
MDVLAPHAREACIPACRWERPARRPTRRLSDDVDVHRIMCDCVRDGMSEQVAAVRGRGAERECRIPEPMAMHRCAMDAD